MTVLKSQNALLIRMITALKITDQKAIKLAESDSVPRIMILFGQNGVGKLTLFYAVKESIMKNVVKNEDVIFVRLSIKSDRMDGGHARVHWR